ncbi:uncharacterized protein LOC130499804 isoform X2 [Raphanus sativus]|uniref:Uncharacterized protein LOC130499804 isoform X2 n=1 Tax=Raphanus sativus TaxID=3726 RepID=A0A9W3CFA9_RAPSA|nr:uncharacterized protein LOC130499804 isoform X2 [Raphanus sativus]
MAKKEKLWEDWCFVCKDGGSLMLCDYKDCPKAYHASCVDNYNNSAEESDDSYICEWHSCYLCGKRPKLLCLCCPRSVCEGCVNHAEFIHLKPNRGLCNQCQEYVVVLEEIQKYDAAGDKLDLTDTNTFECLFLECWEIAKKQEDITFEDVLCAKSSQRKVTKLKHKDAPRSSSLNDAAHTSKSHNRVAKLNHAVGRKYPLSDHKVDDAEDYKTVGKNKNMVFIRWGSKPLIDFLTSIGEDTRDAMSERSVESIINKYIRQENLLDHRKKKKVRCDEKLYSIFGKRSVKQRKIHRLLDAHFKDNTEELECITRSDRGKTERVSQPCKKKQRIERSHEKEVKPYASCVDNYNNAAEESDDSYICEWHSCYLCGKRPKLLCLCCPHSVCEGCVTHAEFVHLKPNKGLCNQCQEYVVVLEEIQKYDTAGDKLDLTDTVTFECLFLECWEIAKKQEDITFEDVLRAKSSQRKVTKLRHKYAPRSSLNDSAHTSKSRNQVAKLKHTVDRKHSLSDHKDAPRSPLNDAYTSKSQKQVAKLKHTVDDDAEDYKPVGKNKNTVFIRWCSKPLIDFLTSIGEDTRRAMSQHNVESVILKYIPQIKKKKVRWDEKLYSIFGKGSVKQRKIHRLLDAHFKDNLEPLECNTRSDRGFIGMSERVSQPWKKKQRIERSHEKTYEKEVKPQIWATKTCEKEVKPQFYPRPGTPAAKRKKVQSKIAKQRIRDLTCVFEAFAPYTGMEGKEERIWITETLSSTNVATKVREEETKPSCTSDVSTCETCACSAESCCGEGKSGGEACNVSGDITKHDHNVFGTQPNLAKQQEDVLGAKSSQRKVTKLRHKDVRRSSSLNAAHTSKSQKQVAKLKDTVDDDAEDCKTVEKNKNTVLIRWCSKSLIDFLTSIGEDTRHAMSERSVESIINKYIRQENLLDHRKKKKVRCDEKLYSIFRKRSVKQRKIHRLLDAHFTDNLEQLERGFSGKNQSVFMPCKCKKKQSIESSTDETYDKELKPDQTGFATINAEENIKLVYLLRSLVLELLKKHNENFGEKVVGTSLDHWRCFSLIRHILPRCIIYYTLFMSFSLCNGDDTRETNNREKRDYWVFLMGVLSGVCLRVAAKGLIWCKKMKDAKNAKKKQNKKKKNKKTMNPENKDPKDMDMNDPGEDDKDMNDPAEDDETALSGTQDVPKPVEKTNLKIGKLGVELDSHVTYSDGIQVFEGKYDARIVSVNRKHLKDDDRDEGSDVASSAFMEMANHYACDTEYILRFYGRESDITYMYMCFEKWECSIGDLIRFCSSEVAVARESLADKQISFLKEFKSKNKLWEEGTGYPTSLLVSLIRDLVQGVADMHDMCYIHGNLNPETVLIVSKDNGDHVAAKIGDLSLSRHRTNKSMSVTGIWPDPEQTPRKSSKTTYQGIEDDVYALGLTMVYMLARRPLYKDEADFKTRTMDQTTVYQLKLLPQEAYYLWKALANFNYELRPTAKEALAHPFFWTQDKRNLLLERASESFRTMKTQSKEYASLIMLVNKSEKEVFKGIKYEWDEVLDEKLVSFMDEKEAEENGPRYNRRHLIDLVRFVRNTLVHVKEEKFPGDVKAIVGGSRTKVGEYFARKFPCLLMEVHMITRNLFSKHEDFQTFFEKA